MQHGVYQPQGVPSPGRKRASRPGGEVKLTEALESVGRYFKISGVLALISLVLTIIGLFAALPVMLQA